MEVLLYIYIYIYMIFLHAKENQIDQVISEISHAQNIAHRGVTYIQTRQKTICPAEVSQAGHKNVNIRDMININQDITVQFGLPQLCTGLSQRKICACMDRRSSVSTNQEESHMMIYRCTCKTAKRLFLYRIMFAFIG